MKTIKTILFIVLGGMLIPTLAANGKEKTDVEIADEAETTPKTESVIEVASLPFQKYVIVTTEESGLYKKADTNSPCLVRWIDSDCESDFCESFYQWSDQPGKPGFDLSTEIIACEGRILPVLGEEGNFYKVYTLNEWCDIESAYIRKDCVGDIESSPIKPDMLEAEDNYFKCRMMKDDKYKNIVLIDEYDELNGESLRVGVLKDGAVATPIAYYIDTYMEIEQNEDIIVKETEGRFVVEYNKNLAVESDGFTQLDLKRLSEEQMAKIVDMVTGKKPEYVNYMVHFPANGLETICYKAK